MTEQGINKVRINLTKETDLGKDFPGGSEGKASVYNVGDPGLSPGLGRSLGEGNGNPLQHYCLENPMDRGAWQAAVCGVTKSRTRLSDFNSLHFTSELGKGKQVWSCQLQNWPQPLSLTLKSSLSSFPPASGMLQ